MLKDASGLRTVVAEAAEAILKAGAMFCILAAVYCQNPAQSENGNSLLQLAENHSLNGRGGVFSQRRDGRDGGSLWQQQQPR